MQTVMQIMQRFVDEARAAAANGLSWGEAGRLVGNVVRLGVAAAAELEDAPGEAKKAIVVRWTEALVDVALPVLPLPVWLRVVAPFVRPAIKAVVMAIADGLIEAAYEQFSGLRARV